MSDLTPALISLDKGLNLQSAKIVATPGSILNTLNYEQVDFQGQKRIDGYTQYDGSFLSAINDWLEIVTYSPLEVEVGELISTMNGLLGVVLEDSSTTTIKLAVINPNLIPVADDQIYITLEGNDDSKGVASVAYGLSLATSPQEHQAQVIAYNQVLRDRVELLPGNVAGLHWFRDRLYAIADVLAIVLAGASPTIYPNDLLVVSSDPDNVETKVLDSFLIPGADGDNRLVLLATLDTASWAQDGVSVTRDSDDMGNIIESGSEVDPLVNQASFFESRSEQQVLDEDGPDGPYDFGWRFVDQGWVVKFEDGISLFGSLPSLNQNISGLGTEGPTSIVDPNGSPLALIQKLPITNKIAQVNGWKSTNSPTTYSLDPSDVADIDSTYTYADAFISWDGTTGIVSAPGLSDNSLTEYPANNTVVVVV